jgi:hypothetical protein
MKKKRGLGQVFVVDDQIEPAVNMKAEARSTLN